MLHQLPKRIVFTRHPECLHNVDHESAIRSGIPNRESPLTRVGELQLVKAGGRMTKFSFVSGVVLLSIASPPGVECYHFLMKKYLVNITDCIDIAASELYAVLTREVEEMADVVVPPITPISPEFSVINTNFAVRLMADSYPENSVLMTTINAEKVRPMNVVGRTKERNIVFIGRNMGSFDWLTRDFGCAELYDLTKYNVGEFISFAGKYVTAKVAAAAARGTSLSELGEAIDPESIVRLDLKAGTIVHIDNFGMMKFFGDMGNAAPGDRFEVVINNHHLTAVYQPRLMSLETGEWAFFEGSSFGLFELGQARDMGGRKLGINVGDVIIWKKI